jgi:hypothetical protein
LDGKGKLVQAENKLPSGPSPFNKPCIVYPELPPLLLQGAYSINALSAGSQ